MPYNPIADVFNSIVASVNLAREDYDDGEIIKAFNSLGRARNKIARAQAHIKSEMARELDQ